MQLQDLVDDVLVHILSFLCPEDLCAISLVNHAFNKYAKLAVQSADFAD